MYYFSRLGDESALTHSQFHLSSYDRQKEDSYLTHVHKVVFYALWKRNALKIKFEKWKNKWMTYMEVEPMMVVSFHVHIHTWSGVPDFNHDVLSSTFMCSSWVHIFLKQHPLSVILYGNHCSKPEFNHSQYNFIDNLKRGEKKREWLC